MKVLMVITSHDQLGNTGRKTGFWLEELAAPYFVFKDSGAEITLASCPFRKFHPAWIRIVRQNHRILVSDVCDPARARNVRRQPVQVAEPA